jgi:hypothetical protein
MPQTVNIGEFTLGNEVAGVAAMQARASKNFVMDNNLSGMVSRTLFLLLGSPNDYGTSLNMLLVTYGSRDRHQLILC